MRVTTIRRDGADVPAALLGDGRLLDLRGATAAGLLALSPATGLIDVIRLDGSALPAVRGLVDQAEAGDSILMERLAAHDLLVDEARAVYANILRPGKILSCGMAYRDHNKEMGGPQPIKPAAFLKAPSAITSHRQPVILPPQQPDMVDFECEFSCVIGRAFHHVEPEDVLKHVAGYTMISDISARESVAAFASGLRGETPAEAFLDAYFRLTLEKQFPTFCPIGPVIHTADSFGSPDDVHIETRLNGELMQSARTSDLIHPLAMTLSYYSYFHRFEPGDIVTTGSPPGVGVARTPPRFLSPGDILETYADGIGTMVNPIAAG